MLKKVFCTTAVFIFFAMSVFSQVNLKEQLWVDSVFNTLNREEKIGQLLMVPVYSYWSEKEIKALLNQIEDYKIGGVIFMQGNPAAQIDIIKRIQKISKVPLLLGTDAEWGLGMRLNETLSYPKQMTLGAIQNDSLIYQMGGQIAEQLKAVGIQMNFAPVVDVNTNAMNPVIGMRSFGENPGNVARKSSMYMAGLQDNGVLANAKHFPGHGATEEDSHLTIPVLNKEEAYLYQEDLFPFQQLTEAGVSSIMSAHVQVPLWDDKYPVSLSDKVLQEILREKMGFDGLIITDALNMHGAADQFETGELELQALKAGNDMLLWPGELSVVMKYLKKAIKRFKLKKTDLDFHVKQVLRAKYRSGLNEAEPLNTDNIVLRLNNPDYKILQRELYEKAATVVQNKHDLVPIRSVDNRYFASIMLDELDVFDNHLDDYTYFSHFNLDDAKLYNRLSAFNVVVVGGVDTPTEDELALLKRLNAEVDLIYCHFGSPYDLAAFEDLEHVLCFYEKNQITQELGTEVLFGAVGASGRLPVTAGVFAEGAGVDTAPLSRLGHGIPETVQMSSRKLEEIDAIAEEAVRGGATPGCQVLVARKGKVIFQRNYGYYTYDSLEKVSDATIYDLASITKVLASLQAFMFLYEKGKVDLDVRIAHYLPELEGTNKANMTFRDILTHQAGLWPYLPFWQSTLLDEGYDTTFYRFHPSSEYAFQVGPSLFSGNVLRDSVYNWVIHSKVRDKKPRIPYDYKYSDMGYYLVQALVERHVNQPLESFMEQNFYDPMGLSTLSYLPLCKYPLSRIAPTEMDTIFRQTLVNGMVHDQGAALLGGVAGHAGLFGNAHDVAEIMQMHLNGGTYGGERYFDQETVNLFSKQQYASNRRGLGWDKPALGVINGPTSYYSSGKTFGHTGFTGTAAWADPEYDLIYVFLSNRIYPDAGNRKLISDNIRTRIQDIIYESIWEFEQFRDVDVNTDSQKNQWKARASK